MCSRIRKHSTVDARPATIAAIVFWKISQYSHQYRNRVDLPRLCKSHDRLLLKDGGEELTHKFFDVTVENIEKVYQEYLR